MTKRPIISLVDDDESARESVPCLVRLLGFDVRTCSSAREFLSCASREETQCLLLEIPMPGMTGLELQAELARLGETIPIVFLTAQHDDDRRPGSIRRGTVDCLPKPFNDNNCATRLIKHSHRFGTKENAHV